jgi:hypothetical protein
MPIKPAQLTDEQMRDILKRQRAAYEHLEIDRLRTPWREPTTEEKLAFDRLMADVNRTRGPSRPCGMVEWYRKLLRMGASDPWQ